MDAQPDVDKARRLSDKRAKIDSNYETISALRSRLAEVKGQSQQGITRSAYIKMIFEMTEKLNQENDELLKVSGETRALQREISNVGDRLGRSFALAKESILECVPNDRWTRNCLGLVNIMHENCDQIVRAVQEAGDMSREIKQLEDQIGQLKALRHVQHVPSD